MNIEKILYVINETPVLLLRIGYGEQLPCSPRSELEEVIEIRK